MDLIRHPHSHHHRGDQAADVPTVSPRTFVAALALTLGFVTVEAVAGWTGHSLALLADAGHNLTDAAALGLSWYALWMARKPSHHGMTYGYHRVAVVAALINATALVVIGVGIGWEAINRLRSPEAADGRLMMITALLAITVNTVISLRLRDGSRHDLNIRSAYLHMVGDALSAASVVLAGVIVTITGSVQADPIVSLVIGAFILGSSYSVLRESAMILLEGTPVGTDMVAVISTIKSVKGVIDVHDLHVWTVGPGVVACSCHVVVAEQTIRQGQRVVRTVATDIERRFHITHTTVQVEVEGCDPNDLYCRKPFQLHRRGA